jgi:hypothetical protein
VIGDGENDVWLGLNEAAADERSLCSFALGQVALISICLCLQSERGLTACAVRSGTSASSLDNRHD